MKALPFELMGKGKNIASTSDTAALKKKLGDWTKSTITEWALSALRREGQLPADSMKVRRPDGEVIPTPEPRECVMFADFVTRGLSLLVHELFHGLLYAYGVQPHHFTPNNILQIACYITLCECFWA